MARPEENLSTSGIGRWEETNNGCSFPHAFLCQGSSVDDQAIDHSRRNKTVNFSLKDEKGEIVAVCKTFLLTTLGYEKKNDRAITNAVSNVPDSNVCPGQEREAFENS